MPPSPPPKLVFELGSGVAGFRVVLLWSKIRGVNNLTERVSVGRLVGCKLLKGKEEKKHIIGRVCQVKAFEYLAYRGHPGCG